MASLREMTAQPEWETVRVKAILTPFPVRFEFPDTARDNIPIGELRSIEGIRLLRFYCNPARGDLISYRGHLFRVTHLLHECQPKGSPRKDQMPIVMTQYNPQV